MRFMQLGKKRDSHLTSVILLRTIFIHEHKTSNATDYETTVFQQEQNLLEKPTTKLSCNQSTNTRRNIKLEKTNTFIYNHEIE